jgi:hypothetical protein
VAEEDLQKSEIRLGKKNDAFLSYGSLTQIPKGIEMRWKCEGVLCFEFDLPKGPKVLKDNT